MTSVIYFHAHMICQIMRPHLHFVHPKKVAAIKIEVEKILHVGFIYPVPLTDWVSKIVPVMKKQGTV